MSDAGPLATNTNALAVITGTLANLLWDKDSHIQGWAAIALDSSVAGMSLQRKRIAERLNSAEFPLNLNLAAGLFQKAGDHEHSVRVFRLLLQSQDAKRIFSTLLELRLMRTNAVMLIPDIIPLLEHPGSGIRCNAAKVLLEMGYKDESVIQALISIALNPEDLAKNIAWQTLGYMEIAPCVKRILIRDWINHPDIAIRTEANKLVIDLMPSARGKPLKTGGLEIDPLP